MKAINVDEWFKGRDDLEEIGDGVIEQLAKNLARLQDVDIAMTPLVDLLTGYTRYRILQSKIDKINEYVDKIYDVMDYKDYPPYLDDIYYTLHPELKEDK